jgi:CheY-like chemotaxis protein
MAQPKMTSRAARILVANNEPQVRKLFVRKLQVAGYAASEASSGQKTLDLLLSARFDVLVLDLDIPGIDSFDVLKAIRSDIPHLRVLVTSAKRELLEAAEWFGAVAAIDKVSAPDRLVTTVKLLLGESPRARPCGSRPGG